MEKILVAVWLVVYISVGVLVIAASLLRCRRCRGWHDSRDEDDRCQQKKDEQ